MRASRRQILVLCLASSIASPSVVHASAGVPGPFGLVGSQMRSVRNALRSAGSSFQGVPLVRAARQQVLAGVWLTKAAGVMVAAIPFGLAHIAVNALHGTSPREEAHLDAAQRKWTMASSHLEAASNMRSAEPGFVTSQLRLAAVGFEAAAVDLTRGGQPLEAAGTYLNASRASLRAAEVGPEHGATHAAMHENLTRAVSTAATAMTLSHSRPDHLSRATTEHARAVRALATFEAHR